MVVSIAFSLALLQTPAPEVALLIQVPKAPRFAEMAAEESRTFLHDTVEKVLRKRLEGAGYRVNLLPERLLEAEPKADNLANLSEFPRVAVIRILNWSHKNRSNEDIVNNPNAPKSETKASFGVWRIANGAIESSQKCDTKVGGPYFGTTDKRSLQGPPDVKAMAIRLVNRDRCEAVGNAVWEGIRLDYPVTGTVR